MNTARQITLRSEPAPAAPLSSTQFRYLKGGSKPLITEVDFVAPPPPKRRRSLRRKMLHAFTTGRRSSGRARNPRFGL